MSRKSPRSPAPRAGKPAPARRAAPAPAPAQPAAPAPVIPEVMELFFAAPPGLEDMLLAEAQEAGFRDLAAVPGGVTARGGWEEAWRANLILRGAGKVLARIGGFRAMHLAQLDKRARKFPWSEILLPDVPVKVEALCRKSRIYHAGAAAERVMRAISEELGAPAAAPEDEETAIRLLVRIEDDFCSFSVDCSGDPLHRRGLKRAVAKAPMRETLAALMLRRCGFDPEQPLLDPMCGSGTFVLEAADIAAGMPPGRIRDFAFEDLSTFDQKAWDAMRRAAIPNAPEGPARFFGSDRNEGAVEAATANAARAGTSALCAFERRSVSEIAPPVDAPGLVMVNPPYGARIGDPGALRALYGSLGAVLKERFRGWRVGIVTSEIPLARATGLPFEPLEPPIPHGGIKVHLHRTKPL